jgi:hypothetical protein
MEDKTNFLIKQRITQKIASKQEYSKDKSKEKEEKNKFPISYID